MNDEIARLKDKSIWLRKQVFETVVKVEKGHLGGTFSCIELFVALYYKLLNLKKGDPNWEGRDRFLIGKGHACLALYYIWEDLGYLSKRRLESYGESGGLGGQLDMSIPGAEHITGSLGHALGIGAGMAFAAKLDKKDYKTIVMVGDAECDEGAIWETAMFAAKNRLNNLIGIIDRNRLSVTEVIEDDEFIGGLSERFTAFGWHTITINGHSFSEILNTFDNLSHINRPIMVIADTIKGKGVSFMENELKWHHSIPTNEEIKSARTELKNGV